MPPFLPHGPEPVEDKVIDQILCHLFTEENIPNQVSGRC
jgi:hypothetical protein